MKNQLHAKFIALRSYPQRQTTLPYFELSSILILCSIVGALQRTLPPLEF